MHKPIASKGTSGRGRLDRLIRALREKQAATPSGTAAGEAIADNAPLDDAPLGDAPLAFAQERLWFLDRLTPGRATYNMPAVLEVTGALDVPALATAMDDVRERHETLRTEIGEAPAHASERSARQPVQRVLPATARPLPVVDLSGLEATRGAKEAASIAHTEACQAFDLTRGPLLRARLLRLSSSLSLGQPSSASSGRHHLVVVMHHIIADGWSIGVLLRDLDLAYTARRHQRTPGWPPLAIQYATVARRQRQPTTQQRIAPELEWWRHALTGLEPLELPADFLRPSEPSERGFEQDLRLDPALIRALRNLAHQQGGTLFMALAAGVAAVLGRFAGTTDVAIGTPVAGRDEAETQDLIGFFVNMLVLRIDLSGAPTFTTLLARTRETVLDAFEHRNVPFDQLVAALQPARAAGRMPLLQVLLALQPAPEPAKLDGLAASQGTVSQGTVSQRTVSQRTVSQRTLPTNTAKFDLSLLLEEGRGDDIHGVVEAADDIFTPATIDRLRRSLQTFLAAAVAAPDTPIARLSLLDHADRARVVVEWPRGARPDESAELIDTLVARQAAERPAAVAVVGADGTTLTYGALEQQAQRLAERLRAAGVSRETVVALLLDRSPALVIAARAVIAAGGAYLPLDPHNPPDRLERMLTDAGCCLLLTRSDLRHRVSAVPGCTIWEVDHLDRTPEDRDPKGHGIEGSATRRATAAPVRDQLAYVIFTSGSTGRPKGVAITHGALANLVAWHRKTYAVTPDDRASLVASTGFDASVWEIWPYLAAGASLHMPAADTVALPAKLSAWLAAQQISLSFLPTPLAEALLDEIKADPSQCPLALRALLTGGDRLGRRGEVLPFDLINHYGPTESAVVATAGRVATASTRSLPPPIGQPIDGVDAYVLDPRLEPVAIGFAGELYLGGASLARGYLGQPGLSAERFVPDLFSNTGGQRLYRTGDRVRWLADGRLAFLGRIDRQVKIRGFRIELGEIEAALAAHADIARAAVEVHAAQDDRLVAFVVPESAVTLDSIALRAWLGKKLPGYMVPSTVVSLDALPLTSRGKIDRDALARMPLPGFIGDAEQVRTPPSTATETAIADIFVEVLGLEQAPVLEDDFFALGGHSLLATRLITGLKRDLGIDLPLRALFDAPTPGALARVVEDLASTDDDPVIEPSDTDQPPPLSFAQERLWFLDRFEPDNPWYNVPAAVRLRGTLDLTALEKTFLAVVARHQVLRTVVPEHEGQPRPTLLPTATAVLSLSDLRALGDAVTQARAEARTFASQPFNLAHGPLLRARLLRVAEDDHFLVLVLHHIVTDEWSMGVLVRELAEVYAASTSGRQPALPTLPIQYGDYARWQRAWLNRAVFAGAKPVRSNLETQLDYWRAALAGAPSRIEIPTDYPRPQIPSYRGADTTLGLDPETTDALRHFAQEQGATLFMTLLAMWSALLSQRSAQDTVVVGSPVANRHRAETQNLIGFFINTLPLRVDVNGKEGLEALVAHTRELTLAAQGHQDLPFERLVQALAPERELGHTPLFQVMLVMQTADTSADVSFPGLELTAEPLAAEVSKFELSLTVADRGATLDLRLAYKTDLFTAGTAERLLHQLRVLIGNAIARPQAAVATLELLSAAERETILRHWSRAPESPLPSPAGTDTQATPQSLHAMIAAQAQRTPDAVAVVFADQNLTYRALMDRARQLAHHLAHLGVGPESVVGVALERSLDMVVALTAVLEAGGAYVPLDPSYPAARLRFMREDARITVLITETAHRDLLSTHEADGTPTDDPPVGDRPVGDPSAGDPSVPVVYLDRDAADWAGRPTEAVASGVQPDDLAYVIYTSGSTGRPKGVAVSHRAIAERLDWVRLHDLDSTCVFLQKTTISFDVSVAEIFAPLVVGGRTILPPPGAAQDTDVLLRLIEQHGVTHTSFPPTLLAALLDEPAIAERTRSVRSLITGGETVPVDLPGRVAEGLGDVVIENRYGPTEATISVTAWHCDPAHEEDRLPIGRPIAGAEIYLVNRQMVPVPVGVPGEIMIGGSCLARGYLGRPSRTAESFVPDPLSDQPGARLYRSGDLARWRQDGALDFIGRRDAQVKVRGFRIELGEIEAALSDLPGVTLAAAAVRPLRGQPRLVGFVVGTGTESDTEVDTASLRHLLSADLPSHMIPELLVAIDALPLASSGKIDRNALAQLPLPARVDDPLGDPEAKRAPRTETERLIVATFADILALDTPPGIDDNFFALGGHSLLATRVMARLRGQLKVELPLRTLFEAPTPADLATAIDAAIDTGQQLDGPSPITLAPITLAPITPAEIDGPQPLTFAQERLWFLNQLDPDSPAYHIPAALRLNGRLQVDALEQAFAALVARHASLRTTFAHQDGAPRQIVHDHLPVPLRVIDLRAISEHTLDDGPRDDRLIAQVIRDQIIRDQTRRPFDLERGPLLRTTLVRLRDDEHALAVVMHHIVSDGWSVGVMVRELSTLYRALAAGKPSPLPPLDIQVADYAHWQQRYLAGDVLDHQLAYWQRQLADAPRQLDLPTDHPRPAERSGRGAAVEALLDADTVARLQALAADRQATPFIVLLAAFQTFLHRHTGQPDIVVGSPVAGRTRAELEPLVGFFVGTLVLRADLSGNPRFLDLIDQARTTTLDAHAHQDVPFEKLVEALDVPRNLASTPLFQAMFSMQNAPRDAIDLGDLVMEALPAEIDSAKFDLTMTATEVPEKDGGRLRLNLAYATDLFTAATAERMLARFAILVRAVVEDPRTRIAALPVMTRGEQQSMAAWNHTAIDYPADATLVSMLEAQVTRTPDQVAVVFDRHPAQREPPADETLSYQELWTRAGRLASVLVAHGVGANVLVGLCAERSLEMMIGLVAILRAGGAYVPLDPAYPRDRLAMMVEDADARVLLVQPPLTDRLPPAAHDSAARDIVLLFPDAGMTGADPLAAGATPPGATPLGATGPTHADDLAYTLFTSGSTGRPKGVMVSHRGVANFLHWLQDTFALTTADRALQKTPISFDASIRELFLPLTTGATLVLARPEGHKDTAYLCDVVTRHAVTILQFVPSLLAAFLEEAAIESCQDLRVIGCGGEAMSPELVASAYRRLPGSALVNTYGPTEATVVATSWPVPRAADGGPEALRVVPIGRPLANTEIRILDPRMRPVPIGVAGELFIGGVQLARGYRRRPALTAERFVPHPQSDQPGARLYASGDLARWRPDGTLEFLGRIDTQVKVRGFRIELGEIEHGLLQHPSVHEAAVLLHEQRLIAWVASDAAQPEILAAHLAARLPDYMVPAAFIVLDRLPHTASGKIDRQAFAQRSTAELVPKQEAFVAPATPVERTIAAIWQQLLEVDRIGLHDHFFDLGGHSLLATRVMARVRGELNIELPLRTLFESPTLAAFATAIDQAVDERRAGDGLPSIIGEPITATDLSEPAPLTFAQERLWFLHQLDPDSAAYHIPAGLRLRGKLQLDAMRLAFAALVDRHASLRTTFVDREGAPRQIVHQQLPVPLPMIDLRGHDDVLRQGGLVDARPAAQIVRDQAHRPFDLERGPLLRTTLVRLADDDHVLAVVMHHIISDGWSVGVMVRELSALYRAFAAGEASPLAPLDIQVPDYAHWQQRVLTGDIVDQQLAYWQRQLAGAPSQLDLPTDHPRPAKRSGRGAIVKTELDVGTLARLQALANERGATLFMVLLTAFQALLHRHTGQQDILVGSPVAGRTRTELEPLIGFFVGTLVLRADLGGDPSFLDLLDQARTTTLDAHAHQDVPFEKLVEALDVPRDLASTPLFQAMFAMQNAPRAAIDLGDLVLDSVQAKVESAKFDLTLTAIEMPANEMPNGDGSGNPEDRLHLSLTYATDLFTATTAEHILARFVTLLRAAIEDPRIAISALPVMADDEHRSIARWNDTATDYPADATLVSMLEAQATRTPDAVALVFDGDTTGEKDGAHSTDPRSYGTLSYGTLWARAGRLADELIQHGVGPNVLVGLCAERSLEMMVGLVAILRAGGAYVPLDPAYPSDRIAMMIEDAGADVLLVQPHLTDRLPRQGLTQILLTADARAGALGGTRDLGSARSTAGHAAGPDDLAYTLFTSGSTGRPKGVMISHRAIANHLRWLQEAFPLGADDRVLQKTPTAFDASVWELFWPLTTGATLVLAQPEGHKDTAYLRDVIARQAVTVAQFVPSLLGAFLEEAAIDRCQDLGRVYCGGEALSPELVGRFHNRFPDATLVNFYGPTEATVEATAWPVPTQAAEGEHALTVVPIGKPVANTEISVLDPHLRPTPIGVPGELFIGGIQLARGYRLRPALTAERFVPDPDSTQPGARLYATGDLARWRTDGTLEYLGRIDTQVKMRGFRIELGEIEQTLIRLPSVQEAAVLGSGAVGSEALTAFVTPSVGGEQADEETLRAGLAKHLPEYMVPDRFIVVETMPLSPNGKVDRRALAARALPARASQQTAYVAPGTATERALVETWQELLGIERIGIHDNFFSLGGHSLLATRVMARVRSALQVELPLRTLFESPTPAELARAIDETQATSVLPPITPEAAPGTLPLCTLPLCTLPLSFAQERLWFLHQLEPDSAAYHIPGAIRLRGALRPATLQRAFAAIVNRHASLRTTFTERDGKPQQLVHDRVSAPLPVFDLRSRGTDTERDSAERDRLVHQIVREQTRRPFDLERGPLLRTVLIRLAEDDHVVAFAMHHIVSDGWSVGVLVRELSALYRAFAADQPSPLPPLDIQVPDYALWQHRHLAGPVLERQLAYWRHQLAGATTQLALPTDHPRPAQRSGRGGAVEAVLDAELVTRLQALAQAPQASGQSATLFMVLLAAFQAFLYRHTHQEDILVGSPVAGRTRTELEPLVGFFVSTLVLRADLRADPSFVDLLDQARATTLDAHAHQDVPFERLVEDLDVPRNLASTPLFQVMFALQNAPRAAIDLGDVVLEPMPAKTGSAKFDLTLTAIEIPADVGRAEDEADRGGGDRLRLSLEYATDLFEPATARRMLERFELLLRAVVDTPQATVASLPLVSHAESQTIARWNDTAIDYRSEPTLLSMIAAQVARTPDKVAGVFDPHPDGPKIQTTLSYRALWQQAGSLASVLVRHGAGPDVLVGLCAERSLELVIGLVAILRAGGAYVPLDPSYPSDRIAMMVEDADARVLLVQPHLTDRLPDQGPTQILLDHDTIFDPGADTDFASRAVEPDDLAYTLFTSGSTGRPKGVMISHRAIANHVRWLQDAFPLGADDRVLHKTPTSFDASVWELFWPLTTGATLVLAQPEGHKDTAYLRDVIARQAITTATFVPSLLGALLEEKIDTCRHLRTVGCGGEALSPELVGRFHNRFPDATLVNFYGPTEATVEATAWPVPTQAAEGEHALTVVPIGKPVANTEISVLDPHLRPTPIGVPGELFIGGIQLARGYRLRPALTAERFVPDPDSTQPGARLYATGDLARWRADGTLEYLGRIDTQVKIRGFRIELGEIEQTLIRLPSVQEAAVLVSGAVDSEALTAFVTPSVGGEQADEETLRAGLAKHLPEYMVPDRFIVVETMPLSPNGKVDRRALAARALPARASQQTAYVAPGTATERALVETWQELLGIERIGIHDNFFSLGGHSLLATRVMARVRSALQVELPLRTLFESPTPAELARAIDETQATSVLPPITPEAAPGTLPLCILPLSFAQERLWFLHQLEPDSAAYHIPGAIRLRGALRPATLQRAFAAIVDRHASLRTTFTERDGKPQQLVHDRGAAPLPVFDLRSRGTHAERDSAERDSAERDSAERDRLVHQIVREQTRRPFDLERGPLLRTVLIRLAEDDHVVAFAMHHIVSDGWSVGVLVRELSALYRAFAADKPSPLPPLDIQVPDYALWQHRHLAGPVLERQLAYWRHQLAGATTQLALPTDHPRPAQRSGRGAAVEAVLDAELVARLQALAQAPQASGQSATLFMVLLAAFQAFLYRHTHQEDILVGSPVAGRTRTELEPLVGFFVSTLVLRADLRGDPSFVDLLAQARATTLDAHAHQDVPFERLVEDLDVPRNLASTPLFQVMFALQNAPRNAIDLDDVVLEPMPAKTGSAKFDLTLTAIEIPADVGKAENDADRGGGDRLRLSLEYATDLFEPATARRMLERFELLLRAVVDTPQATVASLPLVSHAESQTIARWNDTAIDYRSEPTLLSMIAAQVARTPDKVAGIFDPHPDGPKTQTRLTYRALWQQAGSLASVLVRHGVGPDVLVGLCAERSLELLIGLVAILRAGGAYVPLDPSYPSDRIAMMVEDADARVLLVQPHLTDRLPDQGPTQILLDHDTGTGDGSGTDTDFASRAVEPDDLAYTIFTSGSTGRPKGVMISHRAIANHLQWLQDAFPLHADDRVLHKTPTSFDASVWELFWPLTTGATLVLAQPEGHKDTAYLRDVIARQAVTVAQFVPSLLGAFLEEKAIDQCRHLARVYCGGEALSPELVARFHNHFPDAGLINFYGPTEATVEATAWPVDGGTQNSGTIDGDTRKRDSTLTVVPIGRPVANTEVCILDPRMTATPIGVPGELFIGGIQLARGYRRRPGLTAERFVPHPHSKQPGARLYATGDRARWRADGTLEYLGRLDTQVKVRGFRIELAEIEHALLRLSGVRQAAVLVAGSREDGSQGREALIAFVTGEQADENTLRAHLSKRLPEYMVPDRFIAVETMPLSPNGKIDRRALAARAVADLAATYDAATGDAATDDWAPPENATQERIVALWQELLGVERIGIHSSFFELGGHSLLATRVMARLRNRFDIDLPLRALFESPTPAKLARAVDQAQSRVDWTPIVPLAEHEAHTLSFAQERMWLLNQLAPESAAYHIITCLEITGELDIPRLERALAAVVARHAALRTTFVIDDQTDLPRPVIAPPAPTPLPVTDFSGLDAASAETAIETASAREARRPFDLSRDSLVRVRLLRGARDRYRLVIVLHHIISDGWSAPILMRDLDQAYRTNGAPLPPLAIQYQDYAAWQREQLSEPVLAGEIAHWQSVLDGLEPLVLATDRPRPAFQSTRGALCQLEIPKATNDALQQFVRGEDATLFMALLAGFQAVLGQWSGQVDFAVGSPIANRTRAEVEPLVGCFVNTLALRADLSGTPSFRELLLRCRTTALDAYSHQDVPFERLVDALVQQRDPSTPPLFQVLLVLNNREATAARLGDLPFVAHGIETGTAKLDLTLVLTAGPGGLLGAIEYNRDLFDALTIERFGQRLIRFLELAVSSPDQPIVALPWVSDGDRALLDRWSHGEGSWHNAPDVVAEVQRWGQTMPNKPAIVTPTRVATYGDLTQRARRLAERLREL